MCGTTVNKTLTKTEDYSVNHIGFNRKICHKTGIPISGQFYANSYGDIKKAFEEESLSINANIIIAQPLVDSAPAFVLSVFGSDNKFTCEDVRRRWLHIEQEANKIGVEIEGFSTDGDTRILRAMKIRSLLSSTCKNNLKNIYSPYFRFQFNRNKPVSIQDTVHICTKMKTWLTNPKITMTMGKFNVSVKHIETLIETLPKDQHLLYKSHLNNADKMNFKAIDMISNQRVIQLLNQIPDSEATVQYLRMCRMIIQAFLVKSTPIEEGISSIWHVIFFLRIWQHWLQNKTQLMSQKKEKPNQAKRNTKSIKIHKHKKCSNTSSNTKKIFQNNSQNLQNSTNSPRKRQPLRNRKGLKLIRKPNYRKIIKTKNFITSNAYTGIELNGHGLILLLEKCKLRNTNEQFLPWLYSSQPCEKMFRQTRSMTSTYSTMVNYSLYDIINRIHRIQTLNEITDDLSEKLTFPREVDGRMGIDKNNPQHINLPSSQHIKNLIIQSKNKAIQDATRLGLLLKTTNRSCSYIYVTTLTNTRKQASKKQNKTSPNPNYMSFPNSEETTDIEILSSCSKLQLKDYTSQYKKKEHSLPISFLKICDEKGKIMTVRKSSLCWLFSEGGGRLSSDRLLRGKGMSIKQNQLKDHTEDYMQSFSNEIELKKRLRTPLSTENSSKTSITRKNRAKCRKKSIENAISDEDTNEEWVDSGDSADDVCWFENNSEKDEENKCCEVKLVNNFEDLHIGENVLINFRGGKRNTVVYTYACIIQNIFKTENEVEVMSLKVLDDEKKIFRTEESDVSIVPFSSIVGKLPTPEMSLLGDRMRYIFQHSVEVREMV